MSFRELLGLTLVTVALVVIVSVVVGLSIQPLDAADLEPIQVEYVQGPEAFTSFAAWMQHLNTANQPEAPAAKKSKPARRPVALMDPYFAKKHLRGDAWAAWALQYNQREATRGQVTEEVIRGTTTRVETNRGTTTITTTPQITRERYSGGTRTIYNPFCPPLE